jgi:hypothetical protein
MAGATLGASEVIAIPMAAAYRVGGGNTINAIWVWYDAKDTVVAYEWEWNEQVQPN